MRSSRRTDHTQFTAKLLGPILTIAFIAVLLSSCAPKDSANEFQKKPLPTQAVSSRSITKNAAGYIDGTYAAEGDYKSPGGPESVKVTLVLKDGKVADATAVGNATVGKSKMFQEKFAAGVKEAVFGKAIDSLSLTVVNGASLTPMGFMEALEKMKKEAAKKA